MSWNWALMPWHRWVKWSEAPESIEWLHEALVFLFPQSIGGTEVTDVPMGWDGVRCPMYSSTVACLRDVDVHDDSLLQWRTFRSTFRSGRTCGVGRWIYYATIWCDRELSIIFAWTAWTWISVVSLFFGLRLKWMGLLWVTNALFITDYEIWGVIDEAQSLQFARLHNTMATFIVNCDLTLVCSDSFSFVSMSS